MFGQTRAKDQLQKLNSAAAESLPAVHFCVMRLSRIQLAVLDSTQKEFQLITPDDSYFVDDDADGDNDDDDDHDDDDDDDADDDDDDDVDDDAADDDDDDVDDDDDDDDYDADDDADDDDNEDESRPRVSVVRANVG